MVEPQSEESEILAYNFQPLGYAKHPDKLRGASSTEQVRLSEIYRGIYEWHLLFTRVWNLKMLYSVDWKGIEHTAGKTNKLHHNAYQTITFSQDIWEVIKILKSSRPF